MKLYLITLIFIGSISLWARPPVLSEKELSSPPPRIIRVCCAFGAELGLVGIPFFKISHVTSPGELGLHKYLGNHDENDGLIYTLRGGFIDIGHLRDQSDWTAYLYAMIRSSQSKGGTTLQLGYEGGEKSLVFKLPKDLDSADAILLAGKITYDLSLWHEISTWFGASAIPMMPERYSSFSVEDVYSNLLGVILGMEAIRSEMPFEEAMTHLLADTLVSLGAVATQDETYSALEAVRDLWWTRDKRLPNKNVLVTRETDVYTICRPWLVPNWVDYKAVPHNLIVPVNTTNGQPLTLLYELRIGLNYKFPYKEIFPGRTGNEITQDDFDVMLRRVALEVDQLEKETSNDHKNIHSKTESIDVQ